MDHNQASVTQSAQFSGEGTISGPGKNKSPLIAGAVVLLVLITGGALLASNNPTSTKPTPAPINQSNQPIKMETFDKAQADSPVTPDNAEEVAALNQAELEYGLDKNSVDTAVFEGFSSALR